MSHSVNVFYLGDADCHGEESTVVTIFVLRVKGSMMANEVAEFVLEKNSNLIGRTDNKM